MFDMCYDVECRYAVYLYYLSLGAAHMKAAIIGSRSITITNMEQYLPAGITEIISGGAKGVDTSAREYALSHGIKITELFPEYEKYGKAAPLKRNIAIIQMSDIVIAFWDGHSHGTKFVISACKNLNKPIKVFMPI